MESSINCEQNGNGIWLDLFIWLPHTTQYRYLGEITKLKERKDERLLLNGNMFVKGDERQVK